MLIAQRYKGRNYFHKTSNTHRVLNRKGRECSGELKKKLRMEIPYQVRDDAGNGFI